MASRATYPLFKAFTTTGALGDGYKLYTYEAGTSTELTTYQDSAGTTPHTNPIILDSLGEAEIFLAAAAKFTLTDADGNIVTGWPIDNITPYSVAADEVSYNPTGELVSTNVQDALDELETTVTALEEELAVSEDNIYKSTVIYGANVTKTDANELTVSPFKCYGTNSVFLEKLDDTVVTIPSAANTIYHLAAVRLESNDSITVQVYATEAEIAEDETINSYRWLMCWCTNGSSNCEAGYSKGGFHIRTKASEAVLSTGITTSYATVDHTAKIYTDRARLIQYGARDASVNLASITASLDGTDTAYVVGLTAATVTDTSTEVWGNSTTISQGLTPFNADMQFKSSSGTVDLLSRIVEYER